MYKRTIIYNKVKSVKRLNKYIASNRLLEQIKQKIFTYYYGHMN